MINKNKSVYVIQAVDNALDILEQFHENIDELGLSELCKRLNISKTKVFRILATLEHHDFIEKNVASSTFQLGLKSLHLGQTYIKQFGFIQNARPILESLAKRTEETTYAAILKSYHVVCLDTIESDLPLRVVHCVGTKLPFNCTAAGKVLVASMNSNNLQKYIESYELASLSSKTVSDPDELIKHLQRIAELGYAVGDEEFEFGAKCVGAPVRDYTRTVIGALSISGPSIRMTVKRINNELIPLVMEAAKELSFELGYK